MAAKLFAELSGELGESMRNHSLIQGGWYPLTWYCDLHRVAQQITGAGPELARRVGRVSSIEDLTGGLYRVLLRAMSPQFLLKAGSRIFSKYYETGTMIVDESGSGYARARFTHCKGFDHNIWEDVFGGCEGALIACRATNIRINVLSGGGDQDEDALAECRWNT
jgi:hypothetical protein